MKHRPAIGTRVRISRAAGLSREVHGKAGTVVAHHADSIAIIVRLDPQKPLRPYFGTARKFDLRAGLRFRRRENDWCMDYHDVREIVRTPKRTLRRRAGARA